MTTPNRTEAINAVAREITTELLEFLSGASQSAVGLTKAIGLDLSVEGIGDDEEGTRRLDEQKRVEAAILAAMTPAFTDIVSQIIATAALDFMERETDERIRAFFRDRKESYEAAELCEAFGVNEELLERFVDSVVGVENGGFFPWSEVAWGASWRWGWRALTRALGDSFARHYPALRAIQPTFIQLPRFLALEWAGVADTADIAYDISTARVTHADSIGEGAITRWEETKYSAEDLAHIEGFVRGYTRAARFGRAG
jgi:hypothetical protein